MPLVRSFVFAIAILASAQVKMWAGSNIVAEFPFQFSHGLLWVEVQTPGSSSPLHFLLDTGAGVSVINLATAKRLGLQFGKPVTVSGVSTNLIGYWPEKLDAQIQGVRLPTRYLSTDLSALSESCNCPVDGLIGAEFFKKNIVQIDFVAQKIRILESIPSTATESLPLKTRSGGIHVAISVNGQSNQWVRLDTGCASSLQWVTTEEPAQHSEKISIGLAPIAIPQTKTTVHLGHYKFVNVGTGLHTAPIFPGEAGLLGNGLLSRFASCTIDTKANRLLLKTY